MHIWVSHLDKILKLMLVLLMALLVLSVTWQVLSRYMLSAPSSWTEEVARFLLIWLGMLGASYAYRIKVHLGLDLLPDKLTGRSAQLLRYFTLLMIVIFAIAVLIVGGLNLVILTWELKQVSAVLGLPIAYVYSVIPLSGLLICIYSVTALLDEPPVSVEASAGEVS